MKVLVTGAGGFVGHHLVSLLARSGGEIIACSHRPIRESQASSLEIFDIADRGAVDSIINRYRPNIVFHLAAQASVQRSWETPQETYQTNFVGAGNILDALREMPATRVVLAGSAQQYGPLDIGRPIRESDQMQPASPYAVSKVGQEMLGSLYFRQFGVEVVAARSFNHTGPGQSAEYAVGAFCRQIALIEAGLAPPTLQVGRLGSVRDFLDVRDVVEAYRLLVERGQPGEIYNVCSAEGRRVGDLLETLLAFASLAGGVSVTEEPEVRAGDPAVLIGDNSKIRTETGWEPRISIEQSLRDTLDWYRNLVKSEH